MIVDIEFRLMTRLEFEVYRKFESPFGFWAKCTNRGDLPLHIGPAQSPMELGKMVERCLKEELQYHTSWILLESPPTFGEGVPAEVRKIVVADAGNIPLDPPVK